jgi:hypothetical protein
MWMDGMKVGHMGYAAVVPAKLTKTTTCLKSWHNHATAHALWGWSEVPLSLQIGSGMGVKEICKKTAHMPHFVTRIPNNIMHELHSCAAGQV